MTNSDVVRNCFAAYIDQDRATAERLLADDLVFTSPQDDHIDKADYFARCFPTTARLASQELLEIAATEGDHVFVLYEYALRTGGRYRNTEVHTVRDEQVHEIQVFFGGQVDNR